MIIKKYNKIMIIMNQPNMKNNKYIKKKILKIKIKYLMETFKIRKIQMKKMMITFKIIEIITIINHKIIIY